MMEFCLRWFRCLSWGDANSACALLDDLYGDVGVWSSEKVLGEIDRAYHIANGGRLVDSCDATVTDPDLAKGIPYAEFAISEDREGFWMQHELPINGDWSGVHAHFEFSRIANRYAASLRSIFAYGERRDH